MRPQQGWFLEARRFREDATMKRLHALLRAVFVQAFDRSTSRPGASRRKAIGLAGFGLAVSTLATLGIASLTGPAAAQGIPSNLPRNETLILENPEGTIKNAGWFNIWAINAGGQSTGLHQLAMDTFWYIDPQKGVDGVWDNSLASEKPIYNADFTEMTG